MVRIKETLINRLLTSRESRPLRKITGEFSDTNDWLRQSRRHKTPPWKCSSDTTLGKTDPSDGSLLFSSPTIFPAPPIKIS